VNWVATDWLRWAATAVVVAVAIVAGFKSSIILKVVPAAAAVAAVGLALLFLKLHVLRLSPMMLATAGTVAALAVGMVAYVHWDAYVQTCRLQAIRAWDIEDLGYPAEAPAWDYIREQTPEDATIAYANTYLAYPLQGFAHGRRVAAISARKDAPDLISLPRVAERLSGEQLTGRMMAAMYENADRATWLARLSESGARYLLVARGRAGLAPNPVELEYADGDAERFTKVFETASVVVYEVRLDRL
jgi:hypothetical protein